MRILNNDVLLVGLNYKLTINQTVYIYLHIKIGHNPVKVLFSKLKFTKYSNSSNHLKQIIIWFILKISVQVSFQWPSYWNIKVRFGIRFTKNRNIFGFSIRVQLFLPTSLCICTDYFCIIRVTIVFHTSVWIICVFLYFVLDMNLSVWNKYLVNNQAFYKLNV